MSLYMVTGGAGFIGSHLVDALVARGDRVRVLDDLSGGSLDNLSNHVVGEPESGAAVEFLEGDVRDPSSVGRACAGAVGVFHQAAQVSVPRSVEDPETSYQINVMGTQHVLEAAREQGVQRLLFAASSAAYGESQVLPKHEGMAPDPQSPYAEGKLAGEELLAVWGKTHGLKTASLRYFNVFGPRQADDSPYTGVIAIFARALLQGEVVTIHGDGEQTRDFTFVDNAVRANLLAMDADLEPGTVVNVGTGVRVSILDMYRAVARHFQVDTPPRFGPTRSGDVRDSLACLERARDLLGYEPAVTWQDGLALTLEWYRERLGS